MSDPTLNPDTETADLRVADPVRELAEEIVDLAAPNGILSGRPVSAVAGRIRAFLAEQEAEQAGAHRKIVDGLNAMIDVARIQRDEALGQLAALRGALEEAFAVGGDVGLRPIDALLRSLDIMKAALAPDAGRAEAGVLRAAVHHEEVAEEWLDAMERGPASDLPGSPIYHKLAKAKDALSAAVDALRAARGGEGEAPRATFNPPAGEQCATCSCRPELGCPCGCGRSYCLSCMAAHQRAMEGSLTLVREFIAHHPGGVEPGLHQDLSMVAEELTAALRGLPDRAARGGEG